MTTNAPWASAAAVIGGVAWIPVRLGVGVGYSTGFLELTYVEWNMLMVVPLALLIGAMADLALRVRSRLGRIGGWLAAIGLGGMLVGVILEFWIFGGLAGDRDGAALGWLIYLAGLLIHVIGLIGFGIGALRTFGWGSVGVLALVIAALHLAWLPSGVLGDAFVLADQVLIGLGWVAMGLATMRRGTAGP